MFDDITSIIESMEILSILINKKFQKEFDFQIDKIRKDMDLFFTGKKVISYIGDLEKLEQYVKHISRIDLEINT